MNNLMKLRTFLLGLVIIPGSLVQDVYGCFCSPPPSREQQGKMLAIPVDPETKKWWLEEYQGAVLVGKVIKIEKKDVKWLRGETHRMKKVTIEVERAWVGVTTQTFVIYTSLGKDGDC